MGRPADPVQSQPMDDLAPALSRLLGGAAITDLVRLSGGASRETWSFTVEKAGVSPRSKACAKATRLLCTTR